MSGDIQLEGLTKAFGEHVAVAGIDVDMPPGEFFTLLGPSGCGKTTTLRMIAGFEQPTSGRIMLDGTDVARVPPHRRAPWARSSRPRRGPRSPRTRGPASTPRSRRSSSGASRRTQRW